MISTTLVLREMRTSAVCTILFFCVSFTMYLCLFVMSLWAFRFYFNDTLGNVPQSLSLITHFLCATSLQHLNYITLGFIRQSKLHSLHGTYMTDNHDNKLGSHHLK